MVPWEILGQLLERWDITEQCFWMINSDRNLRLKWPFKGVGHTCENTRQVFKFFSHCLILSLFKCLCFSQFDTSWVPNYYGDLQQAGNTFWKMYLKILDLTCPKTEYNLSQELPGWRNTVGRGAAACGVGRGSEGIWRFQ